MRLSSTVFLISAGVLGACGGDDGGTEPPAGDAAVDIGFNKPTAPLKANDEVDRVWTELATPPRLTGCPADVALAADLSATATIVDFQSGNLNPGTSVTLFPNQDVNSPVGAAVVADQEAKISYTIPAGTTRFGYKLTNSNSLDTLLLNQYVSAAKRTEAPPVALADIQIVSNSTGQTLPALIGVSRTDGTGILAGAVRDCDGHEISNFIATVSSTQGTVTHLAGVDTYYFSASIGLPVRHTQRNLADKDGLFMAIEMEPATEAYVQIWGYPTQADVDADNLTLISELRTSVIANTVITGSYEPLAD